VLLSQCGIVFDSGALRANLDPYPVYLKAAASSETTAASSCEEAAMKVYVMQATHDELKLYIWWWIPEIDRLKHTWQDATGK